MKLRPSLTLALCVCSTCLKAEQQSLSFFFTEPATYSDKQTSNEALPIGNGKLAALVYGGVDEEIIQFNEDTVWAGTANDYSHPGASEWLETVREHVWAGEGEKAWNEALKDHGMSRPLRQSPYQPTANLLIDFGHEDVSGYKRSLDLTTATTSVEYEKNGVRYKRESFASFPDQVIAIHLSADRAGALSFSYRFESQHSQQTAYTEADQLLLDAQVNVDRDKRRMQTSSVRFQARAAISHDGGTLYSNKDSIRLEGATTATLILSVASNANNYKDLSANPNDRTRKVIQALQGKSYAKIRSDHLRDYQDLFDRVSLQLPGKERSKLSMDKRLDAIDAEENTPESRIAALQSDLNLVEINFQVGRYLLITGSRPGSQPLTLQGKWNNELDPAWESKMTLNINQEMNYWLAEVANLPETTAPILDLVRDLSQTGAKVAKVHYGAPGWMVHHNTDFWRGAAPINSPGGVWPSGGAWLSMHLWWKYQYSQSIETLRDIYPLMKGAALFFDDFLVVDPREGRPPYLLTNPSHSPEQPNPALGDNGELVPGTTMDNQLIRSLYNYVIQASEILEVDERLREKWISQRSQLPPNQIGKRGQLQEWLEDVDQPNQHRHLSHLVALFPGDEITPQHTPDLAQAIKVNLAWKGDGTNNTSWSQAWKMCLRTALGDGNHAFMILANLFAKSHTDNFVFSRKGHENQIDGNMGSAMGIAQMFLQSDRGEIELLPALPNALPDGSVKGLKARGGYTVDIDWQDGSLTKATLSAPIAQTCRIRYSLPIQVSSSGKRIELRSPEADLYEFELSAKQSYEVTISIP